MATRRLTIKDPHELELRVDYRGDTFTLEAREYERGEVKKELVVQGGDVWLAEHLVRELWKFVRVRRESVERLEEVLGGRPA